ncbi:hypothetical protein GDO86_014706 [Hymenochirus boettgeri]|uniref:Olfactory receptor n=1 Tax=Hymenochirus boettgeri TaxID=247094 RepID=A0A8T2JTW1_9PIPI|nr:hypothetical protein GDO86_014706 [Hymenochirus boettgeri]
MGLPSVPHLRAVSFIVFLCIYLMTILGNLIILSAIGSDSRLHKPMYFFLANLSCLEMCYTSVTVPNILSNIIRKDNSISFGGCMCQVYLFTLCATSECILLAVMAYDRYVAICIPLRYKAIMCHTLCYQLAVASWTAGLVNSTIHGLSMFFLPFCHYKIDRLYCEVQPLLELSCSDVYVNKILITMSALVFGVGFMTFIFICYVFIVGAIIRIPSLAGRAKSFSTCGSHITVVSLYYGALVFMYCRPSSRDSNRIDSGISSIYCMAIPVLNPVIYSLRNKEVKLSVRNLVRSRMQFST